MCLVVSCCRFWFFFFKQKTAYEMRISDWSSDVCSSDLLCRTQITASNGKSRFGLCNICTGQVANLEPVVGGFKVDVKRAHIRLVQRHDGAIDRKSVV